MDGKLPCPHDLDIKMVSLLLQGKLLPLEQAKSVVLFQSVWSEVYAVTVGRGSPCHIPTGQGPSRHLALSFLSGLV